MHQTASVQLERPLFVHVYGGAYQHVFELDSTEERAFLVGSSRAADLCIERPGVAAVEFHVERLQGEVWLVPGYRGGGVLVNGTPLAARRRVDQRLVVDLGALSLELYVSDDEASPGAARSSSAPRPLPPDYGSLLPTDTACTAFAMTPFQATQEGHDEAILKTQPLAVVRPNAVLAEQRTERLAPVVAPPRPAPVETLPLNQTQRIAPVLVPPPAVRPTPTVVVRAAEISPAPAPSLPPPVDSFAALAAQDTTAFDVEACPPVSPPPLADASAPNRAAVAPRAPRTSRPPRRRAGGVLEELGLLAKARPGLVLGGGTAVALLLSLALVGAMQLTTRRSSPPARPPTPLPVVAAPSNPEALASPAARPAFVVVQPPPAPPARPAKAPIVNDPDLVAAVGHLAAGRLSEAAQSYQALATRADGAEVYGKLSALLARRADPSCSAPTNTCPEVVK